MFYIPNLTGPQVGYAYRPLSLGLTLNTLFYASITATLWFTLARGRAALRRRRGLCARCRYDLRGLTPDPATSAITCPECGDIQRSASSARGAGASQ